MIQKPSMTLKDFTCVLVRPACHLISKFSGLGSPAMVSQSENRRCPWALLGVPVKKLTLGYIRSSTGVMRVIESDPKRLRAEIGFVAIPHTGTSRPRGA